MIKKSYWGIMLMTVGILLFGWVFYGYHQQVSVIDSDFETFSTSSSDFFAIARNVIPWEKKVPVDTTTTYLHKHINDGREYVEIKIHFPSTSCIVAHEYAETESQLFAMENVGKIPFFCIAEEAFQIGKTVFSCYTFSVSESSEKPSNYYGYAIGYNEEENSVVYLFFSDEELSYSEPGYLVAKFYP